MKTVTCPDCKREHALFYYVDGAGQKTLRFLCDRHQRFQVTNKLNELDAMRYGVQVHQVEFVPDLEIPTHWSAAWSKKQQDKQQKSLL